MSAAADRLHAIRDRDCRRGQARPARSRRSDTDRGQQGPHRRGDRAVDRRRPARFRRKPGPGGARQMAAAARRAIPDIRAALHRPAAIEQGGRGGAPVRRRSIRSTAPSLLDALATAADQAGPPPDRLCPGQYRRGGAEGRLRDRRGPALGRRGARVAAAARRADGDPARWASSPRLISRCWPSSRGVMASPG